MHVLHVTGALCLGAGNGICWDRSDTYVPAGSVRVEALHYYQHVMHVVHVTGGLCNRARNGVCCEHGDTHEPAGSVMFWCPAQLIACDACDRWVMSQGWEWRLLRPG